MINAFVQVQVQVRGGLPPTLHCPQATGSVGLRTHPSLIWPSQRHWPLQMPQTLSLPVGLKDTDLKANGVHPSEVETESQRGTLTAQGHTAEQN